MRLFLFFGISIYFSVALRCLTNLGSFGILFGVTAKQIVAFFVASFALATFGGSATGSSSAGSSYTVVCHLEGESDPWRPGGTWTLGSRARQRLVVIKIASSDQGATFSGKIAYEHEGLIGFRAKSNRGNGYAVQNQFGGRGASWRDGGTWFIGDTNLSTSLIALDLISIDGGETLIGTMTYNDGRPLACKATRRFLETAKSALLGAPIKAAPEVKPSPPPRPVEPSPSTRTPEWATKEKPFENGLGMRFVPVPITGGPTGGKLVLFSIWDTRVQDYEAYASENPGRGVKAPEGMGAADGGPTQPVVWVDWTSSKAFCAWLATNERTGGRLGARDEYRLPSDHEWSCAVGIGGLEDPEATPENKSGRITDVFPWGTDWPPPAGSGNYSMIATGIGHTTPVGSFAANRYGIYDLGGNVLQWCDDAYSPRSTDRRVLRGSSWGVGDRNGVLSSWRSPAPTNAVNVAFGFRCVLVIDAARP